ncbi:MAG TPA: NAD(P)-dependent oxidoreductase [Planctomycetaceae bacterium]|nr:oxidoreductase [Blastopirellula sp.]HAY82799.1 NAD(P)-dependent oxidoreductase [Planctomycetaceae bacterium]
MNDWQDKVVVVTGGSAGLGLAIARAFGQVGCRVVVAGRDTQKLELAAAQLRASDVGDVLPIACDVTDDEAVAGLVEQTIDAYGQLDVLVNNAGRSSRGVAWQTPLDDFQDLWELNCLAAIRTTQAAAERLIETRGHLVNIGSLSAKTGSPFLGAYPASKFALAGASHQFRLELGPHGVHVLLVCPGPLQRDDAGQRYNQNAEGLPEAARKPGGGVKLKGVDPDVLARKIVRACERRQVELVLPGKARWLFAIAQLWPQLGDWIIERSTSKTKS